MLRFKRKPERHGGVKSKRPKKDNVPHVAQPDDNILILPPRLRPGTPSPEREFDGNQEDEVDLDQTDLAEEQQQILLSPAFIPRRSSTFRQALGTNMTPLTVVTDDSMSRTLQQLAGSASLSSLAAIPIQACVAPSNETLSLVHYLPWRENIMSAVSYAPDASQGQLLAFLKLKAGEELMNIYRYAQVENFPPHLSHPVPDDVRVFDQAIARLDQYFKANSSVMADIQAFRSAKQLPSESCCDFIMRLRKAATRCNFGPDEDKQIVENLAVNSSSDRLKSKAIKPNAIDGGAQSLEEMWRKATAIDRETAAKFRAPHTSSAPMPTAAVVYSISESDKAKIDRLLSQGNTRNQNVACKSPPLSRFPANLGAPRLEPCSGCGSTAHHRTQCFARGKICHNCGKQGHLARVCRQQRKQTKDTKLPHDPRVDLSRSPVSSAPAKIETITSSPKANQVSSE